MFSSPVHTQCFDEWVLVWTHSSGYDSQYGCNEEANFHERAWHQHPSPIASLPDVLAPHGREFQGLTLFATGRALHSTQLHVIASEVP